jgi:hypothetical protein
MHVVPRGLELMTVIRPLRVVACVDERTVTALQFNALWLEDGALVLTDEIHRQRLPRGVHLKANVLEPVTRALDGPESPGDRCADRDRLDLIPSVQPAVRGDRCLE